MNLFTIFSKFLISTLTTYSLYLCKIQKYFIDLLSYVISRQKIFWYEKQQGTIYFEYNYLYELCQSILPRLLPGMWGCSDLGVAPVIYWCHHLQVSLVLILVPRCSLRRLHTEGLLYTVQLVEVLPVAHAITIFRYFLFILRMSFLCCKPIFFNQFYLVKTFCSICMWLFDQSIINSHLFFNLHRVSS